MQNIGHINIGFVDTNFLFFLTLIISLQVSERQNQAFGGGPPLNQVCHSLSLIHGIGFFLCCRCRFQLSNTKAFFFFLVVVVGSEILMLGLCHLNCVCVTNSVIRSLENSFRNLKIFFFIVLLFEIKSLISVL